MRVPVLVLIAGLAACSSSASESDGGGLCAAASFADDAGAGITACRVGAALVECTLPSGGGCTCISDDPSQCPDCGGASCKNVCGTNEFAVGCGGPPGQLPDGGVGSAYQAAPDSCHGELFAPSGTTFACCPCG